MEKHESELVNNFMNEFHEFKSDVTEKLNKIAAEESSSFKVLEDVAHKLEDMSRLIEKNNTETKDQLVQMNEDIEEKIAMLMLRKF